ncbi:hypothetical protein O1611_g9852 [Lasiodiplodia mahajangana]|uniref:Uncharacterized protein n=1 Tax=Lasiodiplodia mahajangana TaxID=1108764 RepID=A0ACC2J4Y0_9PEZI|nr:hypothetical protein O1611_g9852 [Lasiodiplodia mahajangana]
MEEPTDPDRGPWVRNVTTGVLILAVFFVALRLTSRRLRKLKLGIDDWLLLGALLFLFITAGLNYAMLFYGLGRQASSVSMETLQMFLKLLVVSQIIFTTGLMLVKISILQLYLRIFPSRRFRVAVYVVTGVVLAWWAAITLLTIFQCQPISKSYQPWIPGHCIELYGAYFGSGLPDILSDVVILCLPVSQVIKLNTTLTNKIVIGFFFTAGAFATFASINRLVVVFQVDHANGTWTLVEPLAWAVIEQASATVSACLPTLRPLLMKLYDLAKVSVKGSSGDDSALGYNSELVTIGGSTGRARMQGGKFLRLTGNEEDRGMSTDISIGKGHEPDRET